jgi:hypothetical protein
MELGSAMNDRHPSVIERTMAVDVSVIGAADRPGGRHPTIACPQAACHFTARLVDGIGPCGSKVYCCPYHGQWGPGTRVERRSQDRAS